MVWSVQDQEKLKMYIYLFHKWAGLISRLEL